MEAIMSKRHRKTKEFMSSRMMASDGLSLMDADDWYEAPKGRKPKGRERRRMQKPAFYDM
jgi:hypothetical protein